MTPSGLWLGPVQSEAKAAYIRARALGLSSLRALVVGNIASFRDCWAFRSKLAKQVGCSVRTVQRAITQARAEGLLGVARAKKDEHPPNWKSPVPCGWSHRWTVGWGKAGVAVKQAVEAARARFIVRAAVQLPEKKHATLNVRDPLKAGPKWKVDADGREWRSKTPEQIERELNEYLARVPEKPPPE